MARTGGPIGDLLVAIFAWVAKQERERIGDRIRVGQARAKAKGVVFGRPRKPIDLEELCRRRARGESWRRCARALKTPIRTLRRAWQKSQAQFGREQVGNFLGFEQPEGVA